MANDLSRTFLGSGPSGYGVSLVQGAVLTAWNPEDYGNTVTDGAYTFTNCLVGCDPTRLTVGRIWLLMTPGGPMIGGNSYQKPSGVLPPGGDPVDPAPDPGPAPDPDPGPTPDPDAVLVWADEFTGPSLSLATDTGGGTWRTKGYEGGGSVNTGYADFAGSSWNVSPGQHPADFPVTVANSILTITAKRNPGLAGVSNAWIGAYLVTNHLTGLRWRFGYFELRARVPVTGRGMFPALWLFNNVAGRSDGKEGAEIDILEVFGDPDGSPWAAGWHNNPTPGVSGNAGTFTSDITDWHRYGIEWTATKIVYYRDGVQVAEVTGTNATWFATADLGVRINYAMDPNWLSPGDPNRSTTSDPALGTELRLEVDYVRVYDRKPTNLAIGSGDPNPPESGNPGVPWTRTYPDGTAYPTINGGGTATPASLSSLGSAASNNVYNYTGSTITSATSVDFTGKSNITIKGIVMGQGGKLTPKAGTNIVLEISAPYELDAGGETVKWVGQYNKVQIQNSLFGPASPAGTPTTTKNRFIQFGDSTSVGASYGTVKSTTFRNKNGPGNPVHAAGDTEQASGGVRYTLVTGNLFKAVSPFDENDHETCLMGISTLQLTNGQQVIEFNRFEDCRSEPEVISMKMNKSVIRGNTYHNNVGSFCLRHGDDGAIHDNWIYGLEEETGAGSYNRTSAGPRLYGARHQIHHNTIQVNGNGGSRPSATSLYESPLTLDSGDTAPGTTSNGHANIVGVTVEKNLLVKCGNPIMVTDNYGTAPTGLVRDNWVVQCANTPADGVGTKGSSPSKAGLTISGNQVFATTTAAGLTAAPGSQFAAPASADRGARVVYLTAARVGQGATFDPWA